LLAVSRKQILQPVVLDVAVLLRDMEDMLRRLVGEDIRLTIDVAAGAGRIKADPSQFEQVVMNLAANARDAMPDGGHFTIDVRHVDLREGDTDGDLVVPPGAYVLMSVSDTGPGMDTQTRQRAFEPFFTTKGPANNSGLGLATVDGIVKQSGGHVLLDSAPGRGSTFRLYWPRVETPATAGAAVAAGQEAVVPGTETLLLVDDQPALRELGARILDAAGYRVLTASSGDEALRVLDAHRGGIHLVITDVVMPGMNGRQLAQRIADEHPGVQVLFVSGYTDDDALRDGLATQSAHFIAKPYTVEALTRYVRHVLDAPSSRPPA
jgi:CheY-like chemotaxis protein